MKDVVLKIKGKDTIIKCLKPQNDSAYVDSIVKGTDYNNLSQMSIVIVNMCNTEFIIPTQTLFTQNDNLGSTFTASINNTLIPAQSSVNVPVYYNGIYNGTNLNPFYPFVLNGVNVMYELHITKPDTLGTITDIDLQLGNRVSRTFTPLDFVSHYTDIDGDTIVSVLFSGNVSTILYDNVAYIPNTEIPMADIQAGKLKHIAPDTNSLTTTSFNYRVKDSLGNIII